MKQIRLFITFVLFFSFIAIFSIITYASTSDNINSTTMHVRLETDPSVLQLNDGKSPEVNSTNSSIMSIELDKNLSVSKDAYNSMMQTFYTLQPASENYQESKYTVSGITAEGFPEPYAGAYINKNLDLVVLLTESLATAQNISASESSIMAAANTDDLIFTSATYSYHTLVSLMDDIYQYIESGSNGDNGFTIVTYSLDDYGNRVIVGLEDDSPAAVSAFQSTISASPAISFVSTKSESMGEDSMVEPGLKIDNGSVGFHIYKYENKKYIEGFVTAAHCYSPGAVVRSSSGKNVIADAHLTAWQLGGNMDAVFCAIRPDVSYYDKISYINSGTLKNYIDVNLAQGDPVTMVGGETRGEKGIVLSTSIAYIDSKGIHFTDLVSCDYNRSRGDSGGVVISTRSGENWIAGVHRGFINTDDAIFSKAINIVRGLDLTFNDGSN